MTSVKTPRQGKADGNKYDQRDLELQRQLELARDVLREQADALRELAKH